MVIRGEKLIFIGQDKSQCFVVTFVCLFCSFITILRGFLPSKFPTPRSFSNNVGHQRLEAYHSKSVLRCFAFKKSSKLKSFAWVHAKKRRSSNFGSN